VLDNAAFEAEQMGKSFTVEYPPGPWPLYGNPNALESALENIVRNALRYSHTKIESASRWIKTGLVNVDDDGPGVSPEIASRFSGHSTGPTRRATASPAAPAWGWRLSKPLFSSTVAG
jgi:two-component system sensor histidine kinase CpxA